MVDHVAFDPCDCGLVVSRHPELASPRLTARGLVILRLLLIPPALTMRADTVGPASGFVPVKASAPAFQFYAADFLVGTMGMSDEDVGVYIKMLAFQWDRGGLPSCPKAIKTTINSKRKPSETVMKKFTIGSDGLVRNERLEKEREKQLSFRESRSDNAKKRWEKESTSNARASGSTCKTDALQSSSSSSPSSSKLPTVASKQEQRAGGALLELVPKVNSLRAEWQKMPHLSATEMYTLQGCAHSLEGLDESSWSLMRDFLAYVPRGAEKIYQVRSREKFLQTPVDTLTAATEWKKTQGWAVQSSTGGKW